MNMFGRVDALAGLENFLGVIGHVLSLPSALKSLIRLLDFC